MACLADSPLWHETNKAEKMWQESKSIKRFNLSDDLHAFKSLFEATTGKLLEAGENITEIDMKKFQQGIVELNKDLRNPGVLGNKFLRAFIPGFAKSRWSPTTKEFWNRLVEGNEFRANNTNVMMANYNNMIKSLKQAMLEFDGMGTVQDKTAPRFAITSDQRARKKIINEKFSKLSKLEKDLVIKMKNGDPIGHTKELEALFHFLENDGSVFNDFIERVESKTDRGLRYKYRDQLGSRENYINRINKAATEWASIQEISKKHLVRGLSNVKETIKLKYGRLSNTAQKLIDEYTAVEKNLESVEGGYIPHFVMDIMGQTMTLPEALGKVTTTKEVETILAKHVAEVQDINVGLTQRLKKRSKEDNEYFSRNPMLYAHKYIEQVASFNHSSHINRAYVQGLKDITEVILRNPNTKEAQAAEVYSDVLRSMYDKAVSTQRVEDAGTKENLTRILTSLQFTSKLGWSTRGALRNATQQLLNRVYWNVLAQDRASKEYNENAIYKAGLDKQMAEKGLMFLDIASITEGALANTDLLAYGIDLDKGILTFRDQKNILETIAQKSSKVAEHSAVFTRRAENYNRRSTFKTAYHQRYLQLKNLTKYANAEFDSNIRAQMEAAAGTYASRMTNLLHFEYSKFGKSDILASKTGSVLGQFQHYAFSFADLQFKLVKDWNRARKAGDWTGEEFARIYRMALLHSLTNVISGLSDIDFTSYINNDTLDRVVQLATFLTGDEEASKDAFYGKGLVGASGIVPLNDAVEILNLGVAAGYWDMLADEDSTIAWLTGMREYEKIDDLEFAKEVAGMGSIQLERTLRKSLLPLFNSMAGGDEFSLSAALRAEFGLYPGTTSLGIKTRDMSKRMDELRQGKKPVGKLSERNRRKALSAIANL